MFFFSGAGIMKFREFFMNSIFDPSIIVSRVQDTKLTFFELIQALFFIAISSVVVTYLTFWLPNIFFGQTFDELNLILSLVNNNPFIFVFLQCFIMVVVSLIIAFGGQFFKGYGNFMDTLAGVLWINFVLIVINFFQILLIISITVLADILALMATFWSIWALAVFSKELHGFNSLAVTSFVGLLIFSIAVIIMGSVLTFSGFITIEGI